MRSSSLSSAGTPWSPAEAAEFAAQKAARLLRILATDKEAKAGLRFLVSVVGVSAICALGIGSMVGLGDTPRQMPARRDVAKARQMPARRDVAKAGERKADEQAVSMPQAISRERRRRERSAAFKAGRAERQMACDHIVTTPALGASISGDMPADILIPPPPHLGKQA